MGIRNWNHPVVVVKVATLQMKNIVFDVGSKGMVFASFPGPMRRGVVQAEKEGVVFAVSLAHAVNEVHSIARNQIGQIALLGLLFFAHPQIMRPIAGAMGKVVNTACHGAKKFIVT